MNASALPLAFLAALAAASAAPVFEQVAEFERPPLFPLAPLLYRSAESAAFGTTTSGGASDKGAIFSLANDGTLTTRIAFTGIAGAAKGEAPNAGLVAGSNGALFGTTMSGGSDDLGTIFTLSTAGVLTTLVEFTGMAGAEKGSVPNDLVLASDGNYYGTTQAGGANDLGTVFKMTPAGAFTTLIEFTGTSGTRKGSAPVGALVANGSMLYGVTQTGGATDRGTVFKVGTGGSGFTVLAEFTGVSGSKRGMYPAAGLVLHSDGALYGTAEYGGASDAGVIFRITTGGAFTLLRQFADADGAQPAGALLVGADQNLYGTTSAGGAHDRGTIFRISPLGIHEVLASFTGSSGAVRGDSPRAGLSYGAPGEFIGTTLAGGANDTGTFFKITPAGEYTHIADLTTIVGWQPNGGPVSDYGELVVPMDSGGAKGFGTLVRVGTTGGVSVDTVFGSPFGEHPSGALFDAGGYYCGITGDGGTSSRGTIFTYIPGFGSQTLASFSSSSGATPEGPPTLGPDGNYYAAAVEGGASGKGAIVRFTPNGVRSAVVSFTGVAGAARGTRPRAPLALGTDGSLYGVTEAGGTNDRGTIFRLGSDGVLTTLVDLADPGPAVPLGGLIVGPDENFYGATSEGGIGPDPHGTIFRLTPQGNVTVMVTFTDSAPGARGSRPTGALLAALDGTLYGTTIEGGDDGKGTIFKVSPGGTHTLLFSCLQESGSRPLGPLMFADDGFLYGAMREGGPRGGGTVFRLRQLGPHAGNRPPQFALGAVTLCGLAHTGGDTTSVSFDHGATAALGFSTPATIVGPGGSPTPFSATLPGLSPGATIYYRAKALNPSGTSTAPVRSLVVPAPCDAWKLQYFGTTNVSDLDDAEFDGAVNLIEYALVSSPIEPNADALPVPVFCNVSGEFRLSLTLRRDPLRSDITTEVQAASSVAGPWTTIASSSNGAPFTGAGYFAGDAATPGIKLVEIRDIVNVSASSQRFLRLKVTR